MLQKASWISTYYGAIKEISERSAILVTLFAIAEFSVIRWVTLILDKYEKNRKSNA